MGAVLELHTAPSQKRIWFNRAVAPKAVLSLAISQFDTSERLATIEAAIGSSYAKADYSVLYDHVKDVATCADQAARITQQGRRANEIKVVIGKLPVDKTTFLGKDGQRQSFVIPPDKWKAMNATERLAALAKIRADKGLPPKAIWHPDHIERDRVRSLAALFRPLPPLLP